MPVPPVGDPMRPEIDRVRNISPRLQPIIHRPVSLGQIVNMLHHRLRINQIHRLPCHNPQIRPRRLIPDHPPAAVPRQFQDRIPDQLNPPRRQRLPHPRRIQNPVRKIIIVNQRPNLGKFIIVRDRLPALEHPNQFIKNPQILGNPRKLHHIHRIKPRRPRQQRRQPHPQRIPRPELQRHLRTAVKPIPPSPDQMPQPNRITIPRRISPAPLAPLNIPPQPHRHTPQQRQRSSQPISNLFRFHIQHPATQNISKPAKSPISAAQPRLPSPPNMIPLRYKPQRPLPRTPQADHPLPLRGRVRVGVTPPKAQPSRSDAR